ncbi:BCD family MFS transporter [Glacieibacterium sp.]|uniref:BCD family MFS transporter n=1 Tax=Glacieibacterium sp. TaxID=2860237 RepID=UPI003AFFBE1C
MKGVAAQGLGWPGIVRLGLVQSAIGAIVMLGTSLLNRVMVVEYAIPASLPAGLVAWHYAIQLSRPRWGHGSDAGARRTPWIAAGMAALALGAVLAVDATLIMTTRPIAGPLLAVLGFSLIGAGVGAAGTSLLALLASEVAPERRPAAAAMTWIMMIAGIAITAGIVGQLIEPFTPQRLSTVASSVALIALVVALVAIWGAEPERPLPVHGTIPTPFAVVLNEIWADERARRFTIFVFVSMLAYSAQDLILEPFAGLRFGFSPGASTSLSGYQHGGVLAGMILVGVGGNAFSAKAGWMRGWTVGGCLGSALALAGLVIAARTGPGWPLTANVVALGFFNGVFAVAAIGSMMGLAGADGPGREGVRMGVWGAAQAIAFGAGGFLGAAGVDVGRRLLGDAPTAFALVFGVEATLFIVAASIAARIGSAARPRNLTGVTA